MLDEVPDAVLQAYARTAAEHGPGHAEATALRADSTAMREVFAYAATEGQFRYRQLAEDPLDLRNFQPRWLAALARVIALQSPSGSEDDLALRLFSASVPRLQNRQSTLRYRALQVELLLDALRFEEAAHLLKDDHEIAALHHGYLRTDLLNPHGGSPFGTYSEWIERFNIPFTAFGLEAVRLRDGLEAPFDRLQSRDPVRKVDGPLVTVIITTFRPERAALLTAVRSILVQSWQNLEILIVDDASPEEFEPVLEEAAALDPRVRMHRQQSNGGTYLARNAGIRLARGELITCQDSDDYSHPQRIELQARPLTSDRTVPGTRSYCVAVMENLNMHRRGYIPLRANASSLMFRTDIARRLGGFLIARKGADSELHARLERYMDAPVLDIREPLALIRILPESLSRSDFRSGWHHHSRRLFRTAYREWHRAAKPHELELEMGAHPPIDVPARLAVNARPSPPLDIVYAADWRVCAAKQELYIEKMRQMSRSGASVGALHLDSTWAMHRSLSDVSSRLYKSVEAGEVSRVMYDETLDVDTVVVVDPSIIQFAPRTVSALNVTRAVLMIDDELALDGKGAGHIAPESCRSNVQVAFRTTCDVVTVSSAGMGEDDPVSVLSAARSDLLGADRRTPASLSGPTVGFEVPLDRDGERVTRGLVRSLHTRLPAATVNLIGSRSPNVFRQRRAFPETAIYFPYEEMDFRTFCGSVDFIVFGAALGISIETVAACIASGALALCVTESRRSAGGMMIQTTPDRLSAVIRELWSSPEAARSARSSAQHALRHWSSQIDRLAAER